MDNVDVLNNELERISGLMNRRVEILVSRGVVEPKPVYGDVIPKDPDDYLAYRKRFESESGEWVRKATEKDWVLRVLYDNYCSVYFMFNEAEHNLMKDGSGGSFFRTDGSF